jgi:hypothetical protein
MIIRLIMKSLFRLKVERVRVLELRMQVVTKGPQIGDLELQTNYSKKKGQAEIKC